MTRAQLGLVLQQLGRVLGGRPGEEHSDGRLLERFRQQRDETAFTALVQRHGPLVLGVCSRVLGHEQDAEDAFQATFLVLARKAGSIRKTESLGAWLYEVAYRIALKARARAARQRVRERQAADMPRAEHGREELSQELRAQLDEELHRLPERYRRLLLLCDLQGQTHQEAARRLGLPAGSLSRHLGRARALLRERLVQRGITLSAALLTGLLAEEAVAPVSAALVAPTVRAALAFTAGRAAARTVPAAAAALAEGALHALFLTRLKFVLVLVLMTGLALAAAGLALHGAPAPQPRQSDAQAEVPLAGNRLDAFGDPLPRGARARLGTVRFRLSGWAESVLFTPDGRHLISGDWHGGPRLWEASTGRPVLWFGRPDQGLGGHVALSLDGSVLAAAGRDGAIFLMDGRTGRGLRRLEGDGHAVTALAFSPDGKLIASARDITLMRRGQIYPILLCDPATGREVRRLNGHTDTVHRLVFSPDGQTLASAGGRGDPTLRLWDVASGTEVRKLTGHEGELWSVAFSPDGRTLASASMDRTIRLWDAATGREKRRLTGYRDDVMDVAFSPDGKFLASGGGRCDPTLRLWDPDTGRQLWRVERDEGGFHAVAFSPDGNMLAGACRDRTLRLFDVTGGREVRPMPGQFDTVEAVAFTPDGTTVWTFSGDRNLHLWEAATGKEVRAVDTSAGKPERVAFSADGRLAATGGEDHTAHVWDLATGKEVRGLAAPGVVGALVFAPDGRALAVGGRRQRAEAQLWDLGTGRLLHQFPAPSEEGNTVGSLLFTPDGRELVVVTWDGIFQFWDPSTGLESRPGWKHAEGCDGGALSPDGRTLVVGQINGGTVDLYEAATGKERLRCRGWPFRFSPDGRLLASGVGDAVAVWDLATGEEVGRLAGHRGLVMSLAFSPDGRRLASGSQDTTALVWDLTGLPRPPARPALTPERLGRLWQDLAGADAAAAYRAIGTLAGAPEQAVPFLAGRLKPVPPADPKEVARLLADLDSDRFAVRERAGKELQQLGEAAEPGLRQALAGEVSPGVRRRVEELLDRLQGWPAERLRTVRALEALERIGTPEARAVVAKLARQSAGTRTGTAANDVLGRLGRRVR
jgi:RNA polymerase sigma factor (sigma-70 family)